MSLRSPLGRVLGLGSAKSGTEHWWMERLTSVATVPLASWFLVELLRLPDLSYSTVHAWLATPFSGFLAALLIIVFTYHSYLGVTVVTEDYVHGGPRILTLIVLRFAHAFVGGAALFAVLRTSFGAAS